MRFPHRGDKVPASTEIHRQLGRKLPEVLTEPGNSIAPVVVGVDRRDLRQVRQAEQKIGERIAGGGVGHTVGVLSGVVAVEIELSVGCE